MRAAAQGVALSALVLFSFVNSFGQSATKVPNLYARAITASILQMEREWGSIDDSDQGERTRTDYRHMLVLKNPGLTDDAVRSFDGHQVEYLDERAVRERWKELKKPFSVLRVFPAKADGGLLRVLVQVEWVCFEDDRLRFSISDWSNLVFRKDVGADWVVDSVQLGGI